MKSLATFISLICLLFFVCNIEAYGKQTKQDSLEIYELCSAAIENSLDLSDALGYTDEAIFLSNKINCKICLANVFDTIGYIYNENGNVDSTIHYYKKAYFIYKSEGDNEQLLRSLDKLANVYFNSRKYGLLIDFIVAEIENIEIDENSNLLGDIYLTIGYTYEELGLLKKSIDATMDALEIFEKSNDSLGISSSLINIANVSMYDKNYDDALHYINKALVIARLLDDKRTISVCLSNMGNIYSDSKNYEKALNHYNQSLLIDKELEDTPGIAICYNNIGDTYKILGDTVLAISYYIKSLEILDDEYSSIMSVVKCNLAEVYLAKGELRKALNFSLEGFAAAKRSGSNQYILYSYELLHKVYSEMGSYEDAYTYMYRYHNLYDSIFSISKSRYLQEVKAKYRDFEQKTEISTLKKQTASDSILVKLLIAALVLILAILLTMFIVNNMIRHSRRQVKKEKLYYERLLEYSEDFIFVVSKEGKTKYISPSYERRIGRNIENRIGQSAFEFIHPEDLHSVEKEFKDLLMDKRPRNISFRMKDAHDNWITMYAFGQNLLDDPKINGVVVNFWDITQLKKNEELISQSEVKFREIFNSFPDIYFQTDNLGVITEISPSVFNIIGYTREELIGINPFEYEHFISDWGKIAARFESDKKISDHDTRVKTKSGKEIQCSFSLEYIYDKSGNALGIKGVVRDISSRIKNQQRLHESQQELKQANASKEKIFSIIAHDLIGPIGTNKSIVDLIVSQVDILTHDEIVSLIASLKPSLDSTYSLIENLLSWARIQQNRIVPNFESFNLSSLLNSASDLLESQAQRKSINVVVKCGKDITLYADQNQMDIVFRNLISNAIKFSYKGNVVIVDCKKQANYVEVSVADNGVGMSSEQIEQILSGKGATSSQVGTDNEKGTGFGLLIVSDFVKSNKGKLEIKSIPDKGTTFKIILPLQS